MLPFLVQIVPGQRVAFFSLLASFPSYISSPILSFSKLGLKFQFPFRIFSGKYCSAHLILVTGLFSFVDVFFPFCGLSSSSARRIASSCLAWAP